ncbi:Crp/Fnr family transcriptional regulator [Paenibacillus wynnii]|uniref:Crp/Fnr family transcriptional regulator n=1 Tax=Paenibacillus wynnii TaxID=268407 RepID=UPI0027902E16|nr:Crp/Fnr family transcriptional regulator [Paenibacillus wynnii]MDQ0196243.1 CRP-like cAMP-binding protein [Paenibacillus wynnii]
MKPDPAVLQSCLLFRGKSVEDISAMLQTMIYTVKPLRKKELIVNEGETADHIGIILSGQVEVQKNHSNGNNVTIARLGRGQTFGEAVLFRKENVYPATIIAPGTCSVMFISKQELLRLFAADTDMLSSYMENLSERLVMVNQNIEILSVGTLRKRIVFYLLKQADQQNSNSNTLKLPFSRKVWAELLNTARPSLSRELAFLRDNGWIDFKGSVFTLLNREGMEGLLERNSTAKKANQ